MQVVFASNCKEKYFLLSAKIFFDFFLPYSVFFKTHPFNRNIHFLKTTLDYFDGGSWTWVSNSRILTDIAMKYLQNVQNKLPKVTFHQKLPKVQVRQRYPLISSIDIDDQRIKESKID